MNRPCFAVLLILASAPVALFAQPPAKVDNPLEALGISLKPILIESIPNVLYENSQNWGHQVMVPTGLKWQGLKPQVTKSPRNHGEWKHLTISVQEPKKTLDMKIYDVKTIDSEKQTFKAHLTFQMGVNYEQQNWESGLRLWSGSVRARAQVKCDMECENILRTDISKGLPDFVLRIRVTQAKVDYDKLVVEHINGIGGDTAKIIGNTLHDLMKQWRPSIKRDLLAKASAAIVKSADTREIRFGFSSLLKAK